MQEGDVQTRQEISLEIIFGQYRFFLFYGFPPVPGIFYLTPGGSRREPGFFRISPGFNIGGRFSMDLLLLVAIGGA